jgi:hypothetical protein
VTDTKTPDWLSVEYVYGLIAVNTGQSFVKRIKHQIHRLKRQCAKEHIVRVRYNQGLLSGTKLAPQRTKI